MAVIFTATNTQPRMDKVYVKDASQVFEKQRRTFQRYTMAVLFYRTAQMTE